MKTVSCSVDRRQPSGHDRGVNLAYHLEHIDRINLEDRFQGLIADDLSSVIWILQIMLLNVFPYAFDRFWSRELRSMSVSSCKGYCLCD